MISPEYFGSSYDREEFEKIKSARGPATVIFWARENNVPEAEILKFAMEIIEKFADQGDLFFVYRFRKNMKIGTPEEIRKSGDEAYQLYMLMRDKEVSMEIAQDLWGKNSKQYREACKIEDDNE